MNKLFCDVLIFGSGIIGLSLALSLAESGIEVIITDHNNYPISIKNYDTPNIRVSAINYASMEFFKKLNVWKNIPDKFYTTFGHLETWEWLSAVVTFHAKSIGLTDMGCIIENNRLHQALWQKAMQSPRITLYCPCKLIYLEYNNIFWKCILTNFITINSRILIGADGTNSQIRKKLGIGVTGWQYNQCCMLLSIKTEKFKNKTIWQVLTPNGPIGFLPVYDCWGSLMWFDNPEYIFKLSCLSVPILEKKIEKYFYKQLGKIKLYNISVIPLLMNQYAHRYIAAAAALVGDAAHTIHPLAGQGINLGIRDVISLSKLLINLNIFDKNSSIPEEMLMSYQKNRQIDTYLMQLSINGIYFIFHNNLIPLKIARNFAFIVINHFTYLKNKILKYATGI